MLFPVVVVVCLVKGLADCAQLLTLLIAGALETMDF